MRLTDIPKLLRNIRTARRIGLMPLLLRRRSSLSSGVAVFDEPGSYIAVMNDIYRTSPPLYRWLVKHRVI